MEKKVVELFAGVGGFRVGLNKVKDIDIDGKAIENKIFDFVWANQWEPSTSTQHAYECYKTRFNDDDLVISNEDISLVEKGNIPNHSLLCGGFPCQDYSVARSLSNEKGIEGKKGVLWWQIHKILKEKMPPFVLLENVDRLIKAPSKQRGRDFGIMLRCFDDLGYVVEWRVINAADYGHPQRRRRVFIFAYHKSTIYYKKRVKENILDIINTTGIFAKKFPINKIIEKGYSVNLRDFHDLLDVSSNFECSFKNSGIMIDGIINTLTSTPIEEKKFPLKDIIEEKVDQHFYLDENKKIKFAYLRGSKKIERKNPNGDTYYYSEGSMSPYDDLDLPGRTMLTSESSINRSTHIILDNTNRLRLLTPIECERLNQFPDNWTNTMPEKKRYFMMGNALVCGVIEKLGEEISNIIDNEK